MIMKKIMFNDKYNLTELTLSGAKTRTTRIPKSLLCLDDLARCGHDKFEIWRNKLRCFKGDSFVEIKLPYEVGEIVAVAQSYKDANIQFIPYDQGYGNSKDVPGWNNKMFVRAELMPQRIRITDMKVECTQMITDEDCIKEGIEKRWITFDGEKRIVYAASGDDQIFVKPQQAYRHLIQKMYGGAFWNWNIHVLAIYYELVK